MTTTAVPKLNLFKAAVQKIIDEKIQNPNSESEALTFENSDARSKRLTRAGFTSLSTQNSMRGPPVKRSTTLGQFFTNLMGNKEPNEGNSPVKANRLRSLVSTFMKIKKKVTPEREPMSPEIIRHKFQRAFQIIRVMSRLYRISEDIQLYGTSSNLYDLTTRDRTRVRKFLFPSVIDETEMRRNEERNMKWFILHPKSSLRQVWSIVVVFMLVYTAIFTPYRLTFEDVASNGWNVIDYIVDILFFIDILMNFVSAHYDDEGKLVKDISVLAKNYLKSWFILDFLAVFPFDLIQNLFIEDEVLSPSQANFNTIIRLLRLPRLYRLIRLIRINTVFKFIKGTKLVELVELNSMAIKLFGFFLTVVSLMHIMACIWYFIAKMTEGPDTWVAKNDLAGSSNGSIYVASLYYIFVTLATVGYGDISANNIQERLFSICLMILGVAFYSFTIGFTASALSARENRESALKRKISIANEFADEIKAPRSLKSRIAQILEYNSFRNCFSWAGKRELFSEIPITLRYEIVMSMHNKILSSIPFFREHSDKYFVVTVAEMLKPLQVNARDFLWKEGDSAESIYFLITGKVHLISMEYLTPEDRINNVKGSIIFKRFMSGSYFGEIEVITKTRRAYSLQASVESELFCLPKHDYYNVVVAEFPHIHQEFSEIAGERDKRNAESLIEIRNFLQAHIPEEKRISSKLISSRSGSNVLTKDNNLAYTRNNLQHTTSIEMNSQQRITVPERKNSFAYEINLLNQSRDSVRTDLHRPSIDASIANNNRQHRFSGASFISVENLPPNVRKASSDSSVSSTSSLTDSKSASSASSESPSRDTSSGRENDASLTQDIPVSVKTAEILKKKVPNTNMGAVSADIKKPENQLGRARSKSSFISPILTENFRRRRSVGMSIIAVKTGAIISSEESLGEKKKQKDRDKGLLKIAVGVDVDEVSSPDSSGKKKNSGFGKDSKKKKWKSKGKLGSSKKDGKRVKVLEKVRIGKEKQVEKNKDLKKDIASNEVRMKALENTIQSMIQNMQNLIEY